MGIFDWLLIVLIAFFLWRGWRKGLLGMLLQLAGIVLIFLLLAHYFPLVKSGLAVKLGLGNILSAILAVILIVAMIALVVQIVKTLLNKTLKLLHVSFVNSLLGALLGGLTGLLFIVVLSLLIDLVPAFSRPLDKRENHKVYAAVKVVRSELYNAFRLKRIPLTKVFEKPAEKKEETKEDTKK